jgi:hypothetical protein
MPNPRSRGHQKTCGEADCQKELHRKQCDKWNKKNRTYFNARYLSRKLLIVEVKKDSGKSVKADSSLKPQQPVRKLQDVVSPKALVIIEYMVRLLIKRFQDVKRAQHFDNTG